MMDTILVLIGLGVAIAIIFTGGFGLFQGEFGFGGDFFGSGGPRASGPGSYISDSQISSPQYSSGNSVTTAPASEPAIPAGYSVYSQHIRIGNVAYSDSGTLASEYIYLYNADSGKEISISISGWTVENSRGNHYAIGNGYAIPFFDAAAVSIRLRPGDGAYIHSGSSPIGISFRENRCTGYFNETHSFTPSLSGSCPRYDVSKMLQFSDACIRYIENAQNGCRVPQISGIESGVLNETNDDCSTFISENLNYDGCVKNFRNATDFARPTWHAYLQRTQKLWRGLHDKIILRDDQGLIVDAYQY